MNIPYPNIPHGSPEEQIRYLKSYLYQLVDQLNWALNNLNRSKEE